MFGIISDIKLAMKHVAKQEVRNKETEKSLLSVIITSLPTQLILSVYLFSINRI